MKSLLKISIFISFVLSASCLVAQDALRINSEQSGQLSRKLTRKLKRDAARLVLRMAQEEEELRYQPIEIRRDRIDKFYQLLSNIYLKTEEAKAIAQCNIHTFPDPAIDHIILIFDRNVDWADSFQDGIFETQHEEINQLLDRYSLSINKHMQWNDTQDAITIRSKVPLNMAALSNEFSNIQSIDAVELNVPEIKGNDVKIKRLSDRWEVEFQLRFDAYFEEDGQVHSWIFEVSDSGEVEFKEEKGAPVPEWMKCKLANQGISQI